MSRAEHTHPWPPQLHRAACNADRPSAPFHPALPYLLDACTEKHLQGWLGQRQLRTRHAPISHLVCDLEVEPDFILDHPRQRAQLTRPSPAGQWQAWRPDAGHQLSVGNHCKHVAAMSAARHRGWCHAGPDKPRVLSWVEELVLRVDCRCQEEVPPGGGVLEIVPHVEVERQPAPLHRDRQGQTPRQRRRVVEHRARADQPAAVRQRGRSRHPARLVGRSPARNRSARLRPRAEARCRGVERLRPAASVATTATRPAAARASHAWLKSVGASTPAASSGPCWPPGRRRP